MERADERGGAHNLLIGFREFNLEVQENIVCRFAPAGRDVYRPDCPFFTPKLRRSEIAFACFGNRSAAGFAPNGARSLAVRSWL